MGAARVARPPIQPASGFVKTAASNSRGKHVAALSLNNTNMSFRAQRGISLCVRQYRKLKTARPCWVEESIRARFLAALGMTLSGG